MHRFSEADRKQSESVFKRCLKSLEPETKAALNPNQTPDDSKELTNVFEKSYLLSESAMIMIFTVACLMFFVGIIGKIIDIYFPIFLVMAITGLFTTVPSGLLYLRYSEEYGVFTFAGLQVMTGTFLLYLLSTSFLNNVENSQMAIHGYSFIFFICFQVCFYYLLTVYGVNICCHFLVETLFEI